MTTTCSSCENQIDLDKVDRIINEEFGANKEHLIMIMQAVQKECQYLPGKVLMHLSSRLDVPLTQVYGIATFYSSLSLQPRGRHIINICTGTACHLKGSHRVVNQLSSKLGVPTGETTADRMFTLETVNCVGACALAMVAVIDDKYYPGTSAEKLSQTIDSLNSARGEQAHEHK